MKDCTCVGSCRGKEGLGPGWRCVMEGGVQEDRPTSDFPAIKVGDEVALYSGHAVGPTTTVVTRLTPTQIVVKGDTRFRRTNGRAVGEQFAWHPAFIAPMTDELRAQIWRTRAIHALKNMDWNRFDDAVLRDVIARLPKAKS
jgi:hypothetical protein